MLTYERLIHLLEYNEFTGIFKWKVSPNVCIKIGDIAGSKGIEGYIQIIVEGASYKAHRLAWFFYYGYMPESEIDHIDKLPEHRHHNWISNLREASHQCQMRNRGNFKNNTSGVKGVFWNKNTNKWRAQICVDKKQKQLGSYKDFDNAVCARLAGEQCLDWAGCDIDSPAYLYVQRII